MDRAENISPLVTRKIGKSNNDEWAEESKGISRKINLERLNKIFLKVETNFKIRSESFLTQSINKY